MIFNSIIPVNDNNFCLQMTDFAYRRITLFIPSFSSQSERANNAIHSFRIHVYLHLLFTSTSAKNC